MQGYKLHGCFYFLLFHQANSLLIFLTIITLYETREEAGIPKNIKDILKDFVKKKTINLLIFHEGKNKNNFLEKSIKN